MLDGMDTDMKLFGAVFRSEQIISSAVADARAAKIAAMDFHSPFPVAARTSMGVIHRSSCTLKLRFSSARLKRLVCLLIATASRGYAAPPALEFQVDTVATGARQLEAGGPRISDKLRKRLRAHSSRANL